MCGDPYPNTHLEKMMLKLHYRVIALFDTGEEKNHQFTMDNICNSAHFFKAAYNHEKKTDSWCYKERNKRNTAMCYTGGIEVKEGIY